MAAKLKIISEKGKGEIFELNSEKISVGRDKTNEIVLNDASVSRHHCEIETRNEKYYINDSGSLNGTTVNGREAEDSEITSGDKIGVGDFTFLFLAEGAAENTSGVFFDKTEF